MFPEYKIIEKAEGYYGTYRISATTGTINTNQRVIINLCDTMFQIWEEWQADTRHYQPSQAKCKGYLDKIEAERKKLNKLLPEYDTARAVIKDYKLFIRLVVEYRVPHRRKCRVF